MISVYVKVEKNTSNVVENNYTQQPFSKAGVSCFNDSAVLNSSFVHLMKFGAKNPRLRKAAKRWQ